MDDLVQWLGAQLDEDERIARAAAKHVSAPPNDGVRWRRDWDTIHTAPSDPPGPRRQVADCGHGGGDLTAHIVRHDPARVLREIDAKRQLLTDLAPLLAQTDATIDSEWNGHDDLHGRLLTYLALPYADRPGYRDEWRP